MDLDDEELKATRRMNGSDKNVVCMEEDVKHIEYVLDLYKENGEFGGRYISGNLFEKDFIAIEHLIEAYKELKEENEIIKGNYYTLCADIQMVTSELGFPEDTIIADEMISKIKENYIPVSLVKENLEELEKQYKFYNSDKRETKNIAKGYYIAIQKLKELLEGK